MPDEERPDPSARMRTPLLTLITRESLDLDYETVARRRRARSVATGEAPAPPRRSGAGRAAVTAIVLSFGLMVAVAAVQTSRNAEVEDQSRAGLIDRIEARREAVRALLAAAAEQREQNADLEQAHLTLGDAQADLERQRTRIQVPTGFTPVRGEGVRLVIDQPDFVDEDDQIRDSDLALIVNALWTAGAEAISINDQRLTARSGIAHSGRAIEVNSTGIAPPFTVLAIGPTATLQADLIETSSGQRFVDLASQFGWTYDLDNVDDLRLGAAPERLLGLRSVRELGNDDRPEGEELP